MDSVKKLYRSETDKMIAGVCGGLAEYLGIDSIIVRLIFLVLVFWNGAGLLIYLLLAIITPTYSKVGQQPEKAARENVASYKSQVRETVESVRYNISSRQLSLRIWFGWGLLILGLLILLDNYQLLSFNFWNWVGRLWPTLLIAAGLAILVRYND